MKTVQYFSDQQINIVGQSYKVSNQKDLEIFYNLIKDIPDCIMLDIGANKGYYSLLTTLKPDLYFYAFEPLTLVYNRFLIKNLSLNKVLDRGETYNFGLSNERSIQELWYDNTENATLKRDTEKENEIIEKRNSVKEERKGFFRYKSEKANFNKLDDTISTLNNPKITVAKIDVEGAEGLVIDGGIEFLKEEKPILFIEIEERHCKRFGLSVDDVLNKLKNIGYSNIKNEGINYILT